MAIQLKIQIQGITKPPVWRRILIPDSFSFRQLHYAIQFAFEWGTAHLYQFEQQPFGSGWRISEPNEDDIMYSSPTIPAAETNVRQFIENMGLEKFVYVYDFGDNWVHKIIVEAFTKDKSRLPKCLAGKGAPPIEDCGGSYGYEELKAMLLNPDKSAEEIEQLEWAGMYYADDEEDKPYDINYFDIETVKDIFRHFKLYSDDLDLIYEGNERVVPNTDTDEEDEDEVDDYEYDKEEDLESRVKAFEKSFIEKAYSACMNELPTDISENIERIRANEEVFENLMTLLNQAKDTTQKKEQQKLIRQAGKLCKKLLLYIFSADWLVDMRLDQNGKLPKNMQREVLKEDKIIELFDNIQTMFLM